MISFRVTSLAAPRATRAIVASLALAAFLAPNAYADCNDESAGTTELGFSTCDTAWDAVDIDAALNEQTAATAKSDESGIPWIARRDRTVPVTVNPSDAGIAMRTSLDDMRNYNAQTATRDFADPSSAPGALALPKPSARKSPLDVWTSVDVNGYNGQPDQAARAGVGADYKLSRSATVGVSAERGDAHVSAGTEVDSKASAYITLQAAPMLSLDARTEWQAGNAEFATVSGAAEKSSVTLAPKLNHSFALDNGKTLEPFVTYKREFDVNTTGREEMDAAAIAAERSAEAGIKYVSPDSYTLSVTTGVDGVGAPESDRSINSKFNLSVPIN